MKKLTTDQFVKVMSHSIQKVEKSVEQMERHTTISKTEQVQLMQAVLELADRIKSIEAHVKMINK
ncbi:hypothetical protein ACIQYS_06365 [Psychrobacillus sp. NPDC096426]|uniref:hypothetical protein n=1 Tax=Psychrobacillus sp. NPDC096426 TaxID=3364491 RepID=UPI00381A5611